jgi:hypothetical protein
MGDAAGFSKRDRDNIREAANLLEMARAELTWAGKATADVPSQLKSLARSMRQDGYNKDSLGLIYGAAEFIAKMTKPLTLAECRDILNAHQYQLESEGPWRIDGDYAFEGLATDAYEGELQFSLFEATAIARALLMQGGAS